MKKGNLSMLLICIITITLTGCGSSKVKEEDVVKDLNDTMTQCIDQGDRSACTMNWRLQEYLDTYSSYSLLHTSQNEFTVKPKEPNSLFTYGASRDGLCAYKYALFYNEDSDNYYSVTMECEEGESVPTFTQATELK